MSLLHRVLSHCRYLATAAFLLALQWLLPSTLWAASAPEGPKVHDDTMPYLLVILCLTLGLILLCRSSSRSKEIRLLELDDD